jgi:hypothetical protein
VDQRAQAEALQEYFEKMTELVREHKLRTRPHPYDDVRILARAQTLTVLRGLDPTRKRVVLEFLRELRSVIMNEHDLGDVRVYPRVVGLRGADLTNASLRGVQLISTDRKEPVSMEGAILESADLRYADLKRADLRGANMRSADLRGACLWGVDLDDSGETKRPADLRGADLRKTEGLDEELLSKAIGDRTTKRPGDLKGFNAWRKPPDERSCGG